MRGWKEIMGENGVGREQTLCQRSGGQKCSVVRKLMARIGTGSSPQLLPMPPSLTAHLCSNGTLSGVFPRPPHLNYNSCP